MEAEAGHTNTLKQQKRKVARQAFVYMTHGHNAVVLIVASAFFMQSYSNGILEFSRLTCHQLKQNWGYTRFNVFGY